MNVSSSLSIFSIFAQVMFVIYGLFILLGLYCLYLLIKFLIRGIKALDIYIEKNNRKFGD